MKISAKTRYGIAAMINIAQNYSRDEYVPIVSISEQLSISKIYLEQVFSLLKRANLVISTKGAQGGYQLSRPASEISVLDIFKAIEQNFFEKPEATVPNTAQDIEKAMQNIVFYKIDNVLEIALKNITILDLVNEAEKNKSDDNYMFYI
ncbi:MAG: transcriptional regulator [Clostridiales bacterium]|nr:transcriptional regulator [Clostridiales bacterium]